MDKTALLIRKATLEEELKRINQQLVIAENLEKPFVANVSAYSGHYSTQFKTEEQGRKKLKEYAGKTYFKNGLNYGVYLYKWNEDGTKTLLESIPMGHQEFTPNLR